MSLEYPAAADVESDRVTRIRDTLASIIEDNNTLSDVRRGSINDFVLQPRAILTAATEQAIETAAAQLSLVAAAADPDSVSEDNLDLIIGNLNLVRRPATIAEGQMTVVVSANAANTIVAGTEFTVGGLTFVATGNSVRPTTGSALSATDRVLRSIGGGLYAFEADVEASEAGVAYNVAAGVVATAIDPTPANYVRSSVYTSFSGGEDEETNSELVARQQTGLASRVWSNRTTIYAALLDALPTLRGVSVIGAGDPEMFRDAHGLWPISTGGRADIYLAPAGYTDVVLTKTATLQSKVGAIGTWQFSLEADDAPGFYEVRRVVLPNTDPNTASFTISSETRAVDLTGDLPPDLADATEGAYSAFQTATVLFADTTTDATSLTNGVSTADYEVTVRYVEGVDTAQALWDDADARPWSGDVVVKAAVPCFTTIVLTLNVVQGTTVDTAAYTTELVRLIHLLGFSGSLTTYTLNAAAAIVTGFRSISGVTLTGSIRQPNGTLVPLSSATTLTIPDDPSDLVTSRTTCFLTDASRITVNVAYVAAS